MKRLLFITVSIFQIFSMVGCAPPEKKVIDSPADSAARLQDGGPKGSSNLNQLEWKHLPEHLADLKNTAEPTNALYGFSLKFPSSFQCLTNQNYASQNFIFQGPSRPDKSFPSLLIGIIPKPEKQARADSIEMTLRSAMDATRQIYPQKWDEQPVELGLMNEVPTVRQRWKAFDQNLKAPVEGFFCVQQVGDTLILLASHDWGNDKVRTDSLNRAEAAIHTFQHKKKPKEPITSAKKSH